MIVKPYKAASRLRDARERAGATAENEMAHYLNRKFQSDPDVYVLHQLRIEDPDQPEQDGSPGVCQVDHLVVHQWGFFLVESKSVTEVIQIRSDVDGDDEWTRTHRGKQQGMPSPILQAKRQSEFLRNLLQRDPSELVGRVPFGLRTVSRIVSHTDQRGFGKAPMQLVVAISDRGRIRRMDGWKAPQKPFRVFVTKADLVPDKIDSELEKHRTGANPFHIRPVGDYGLWSMEPQEVPRVAEFLAACHTEPTLPVPRPDAEVKQGGFKKTRKQFPNAGELWTPEEERELCRLHDDGWRIPRLAEHFGRRPGGIRSRLRKLAKG